MRAAGARLTAAVFAELIHASPKDVGTALSIVVASTPPACREVFEKSYAHDRLTADDKFGWWRE